MPLTDTAIKKAKPEAKPYKLADGGGLFVLVHTNGSKYWRLKYRHAGKEKLLALGVYPEISLMEARTRREEARKLLAHGTDPGAAKQEAKQAQLVAQQNNFADVARDCHLRRSPGWTTGHAAQWIKNMERYAFPIIGHKPVNEISPADLFRIVRPMEQEGKFETRDRLIQSIGTVFKHAIAYGLATYNPAADIRAGLAATPISKNFASLCDAKHPERPLDVKELADFLRALRLYEQQPRVSIFSVAATRLLMLTAVRTSEVRFAKWQDIDLERASWVIPAEQTGRKGRIGDRRAHYVPLSRQAVAILQAIQPISAHGDYVFPNRNRSGKTITENTILKVIENIGYKGRMTGHGFRSLARTVLGEMGHRFEVLEAMLSHRHKDQTVAAYDRAQYIEERRTMMQQYADYLDNIEQGADVIPFHYKPTRRKNQT